MNLKPPDIVRADKGLRLKVLAGAALVALLAVLFSHHWTHLLDEVRILGKNQPDLALKKLVFYVRVIFGVGLVLVGVVGARMLRTAVRIIRSNRFPPPGMKVLRDTPVITGSGARMRAILLILVTILVVGSQLFLLFYLPATLEKIGAMRGHRPVAIQFCPSQSPDTFSRFDWLRSGWDPAMPNQEPSI